VIVDLSQPPIRHVARISHRSSAVRRVRRRARAHDARASLFSPPRDVRARANGARRRVVV
jgi:hypothetical protein